MEGEHFRMTDAASLVAWAASPLVVERWQRYNEQDMPRCGDATLLRHLRRLQRQAALLQASGLDAALAEDPPGCDALLSDICAVATWEAWPAVPLHSLGSGEVPLTSLRRGLLGCDDSVEGVVLWVLDSFRIALCRHRQAADRGDMSAHWAQHQH